MVKPVQGMTRQGCHQPGWVVCSQIISMNLIAPECAEL